MELAVLIGGRSAGTLDLSSSSPVFDYDPAYGGYDGPPLSVRFPIASGGGEGDELRAWLEGLLPDDDGILRALRSEHDLDRSDTLQLLGTPMGADCAGAVQFCPPDQASALAADKGGADPISEAEIADWLRAQQVDPARRGRRSPDADSGFSLAGMQPKVAVRRTENGGWAVPCGATPTTHIIKAARPGPYPHEAVVEHLTQAAASRVGIPAARSSVAAYDGVEVIVVERFDRPAGGAHRIHQEDMCQALGQPPSMKYQRDGGPGPDEIAGVLREHCDPGNTGDVERFCDCLLYQWISASTDGHAKNYGLLLPGSGIVRLAPLYDTASWLPYSAGRPTRNIRLAMKIGKDYRLSSADRESALRRTADRLGLGRAAVAERAAELAAAVPGALAGAVAALPAAMRGSPQVASLETAMSARSRRCQATAERAAAEFRSAAAGGGGSAPDGGAAGIRPGAPGTAPRCGHIGVQTRRPCTRPPHRGDDHRY